MNSSTLFLVSIIIFMLTSPSLSTENDDLVLDYYGNPLKKDVGYSITLPGSRALGGSVFVAPPLENNETCEADVVLVRVLPISGTPFTFTPVNASEDVIKIGSPLAIQSPTQNPCGGSTVWQVSSREGLFTSIITSGGIVNTGPSCFRITSAQSEFQPNAYMFEYCPYLCGGAKICWPVGTYVSESSRKLEHLSIKGSPLSFYFFKASESVAKQDVASS